MAATGQTPLIHYYNNTTSTAPSLANLVNGELAINTFSGKLYYRTSAGAVAVLADATTVTNVTTLSFGSTGLTPSTATSGAITVAGTLGAANGGTGVNASTGANSVMLRDANQNTKINNISFGTASTATSASPISLTVASAAVQNFTGTLNQVLNLPDATTLNTGAIYYINNESSGTVTIRNNGGVTLYVVYTGGATQLTLLTNGTSNGTWQQSAFLPNNVTWSLTTLVATSTAAQFSTLTTATTASIGTALTLGTPLTTANGGTGLASFTAGDLVYFASGTAFTKLPIGSNGAVLTSSGTAPQWTSSASFGVSTFQTSLSGLTPSSATGGVVTLAGTLGATSGGTGFSTYATGDLVYASASNTLSKLTAGTNGYVLTLASGVPTWAASTGGVVSINFGSTGLTPNTATGGVVNVGGLLGAGYGGTGQSTYAVGDMLYASATTPTISKLTLGAADQVMTVNSGATGPQWVNQSTLTAGKATNVVGGAAGSVLYQSAADTTAKLAIGTAYQILAVNAGATAPSYQTMTSLLDNNFSSGQGTILYRSASAWTALGAGTNGYVLTAGGTGANVTWAAAAAGLTGFTAALNTSSPNNTNNVSSVTASGGTTNQFVAIVPKGTGGLMAQIPDSLSTGGNVRGAQSTDWQQARNNNTEVASGSKSVICGGEANTSAGNRSFVGAGYNNNISTAGFASSIMGGYNNEISGMLNGYATVAGGNDNRCLGTYADWATIGGGQGNRASGTGSTIVGGYYGNTNQISKAFVYGGGAMGASTGNSGGNQFGIYPLGTTTTDATATILVSDTGAASNTNQVLLRTNSAFSFRAVVVGAVTGGGNMKAWSIVGAIKQGASAGTTAFVGTPATNIDAGDAGASTWLAVAGVDTSNGALKITVTGQASTTIKWMATVYTPEVAF